VDQDLSDLEATGPRGPGFIKKWRLLQILLGMESQLPRLPFFVTQIGGRRERGKQGTEF
jgi:hypothetical protein